MVGIVAEVARELVRSTRVFKLVEFVAFVSDEAFFGWKNASN